MFSIEINNRIYDCNSGETILDVLRRNQIQVPTFCFLKGHSPTGACRMCVVEIEGRRNLAASCSEPVVEGMKIKTHSPRVVEARETILELLLANHPNDCLFCEKSGHCEFQKITNQYEVMRGAFPRLDKLKAIDDSSPSIIRDPNKCILCGRCVLVCREVEGVAAIDRTGRGGQTVIASSGLIPQGLSRCINCGQCVLVCPTGALTESSEIPEVLKVLQDPTKKVVAQYAPSVTISLAEEFNLPAGTDLNGVLNAALRKMGFYRVFDTSFTADLTILEESAELIERVTKGGKLPMITSCCPGWVKFAEEFYPELLPHLSTCKSPQMMMGAMIKSYWAEKERLSLDEIYSVSFMPCTAKKFEKGRGEMKREERQDVDSVLTTRELIKLIHFFGIEMDKMTPEDTDPPFGQRSTAGKIFGASGGVMEAALRTAYEKITGENMTDLTISAVRGLEGVKEALMKIGNTEVKIGVVSGLKNVKHFLEEVKNGTSDLQFIEVMACPGGCINGGGQPVEQETDTLIARMRALYTIDKQENLRTSHENPFIQQLYREYLGEPLSEKSHHLLHTRYLDRSDLE